MSNKKKQKNNIFITILIVIILGIAYFFDIPIGEKEFTKDWANNIAYVHYIDVGQGDSTLIEAKDINVLIDAGERNSGVLEYLKEQGITKIDYVIATHPHSDHIGGMVDIINNFEIKNFLMPKAVHTTKTFENMIEALEKSVDTIVTIPNIGDTFGNGDLVFTVLSPEDKEYDNLNNYSIALKLDAMDSVFIFTGDNEIQSEEEILNTNINIDADVLKLAHHGSSTSSSQVFLDSISPDYVIISCGKDNTYGHPHKEIMERINKMNSTIYRTDKDGTIIVSTDGSNLEFIKEK